MPGSFAHWRLELFFKSQQELKTLAVFLRDKNVRRLNITNKNKKDDLTKWVSTLCHEIPGVDVCTHWATKYNYSGGAEGTHAALEAFLGQLKSMQQTNVLLISGGGQKRAYNTVPALEMLGESDAGITRGMMLTVAYNPYLPEESDQADEMERLRQKLKSGLVRGVYLQTGCDVARLRRALQFIQDEIKAVPHPVDILGSIFVPSKQLLARMKFRPWSGVYLSEEYLSSVEAAEAITTNILRVYHEHDVVPLLETRIADDKALDHALDLLARGCDGERLTLCESSGFVTGPGCAVGQSEGVACSADLGTQKAQNRESDEGKDGTGFRSSPHANTARNGKRSVRQRLA